MWPLQGSAVPWASGYSLEKKHPGPDPGLPNFSSLNYKIVSTNEIVHENPRYSKNKIKGALVHLGPDPLLPCPAPESALEPTPGGSGRTVPYYTVSTCGDGLPMDLGSQNYEYPSDTHTAPSSINQVVSYYVLDVRRQNISTGAVLAAQNNCI